MIGVRNNSYWWPCLTSALADRCPNKMKLNKLCFEIIPSWWIHSHTLLLKIVPSGTSLSTSLGNTFGAILIYFFTKKNCIDTFVSIFLITNPSVGKRVLYLEETGYICVCVVFNQYMNVRPSSNFVNIRLDDLSSSYPKVHGSDALTRLVS